MSYTIVYDRKFIRTSRGIIPMILSGSNNCTEFIWRGGRQFERRAREWWSWTPSPLPLKDLPESEYQKAISAHCADSEGHELCKWQSSWLSDKQWGDWFKRGCDAARSLEEYLDNNRDQSFVGRIVVYPCKNKMSSYHELYEFLHSTQELENWLDKAHARLPELQAEVGTEGKAYIHLCFDGNEPLKIAPAKITGKVLAKGLGGYVTAYIPCKSLSFSADPAAAIVFDSIDDARDKLGSFWNIRFVKAAFALVKRNYILQFKEGHFGHGYFRRRTSGHLYVTHDTNLAHRFTSKAEAIRYAEKLSDRFTAIGTRFSVINVADESSEEFETKKAEVSENDT